MNYSRNVKWKNSLPTRNKPAQLTLHIVYALPYNFTKSTTKTPTSYSLTSLKPLTPLTMISSLNSWPSTVPLTPTLINVIRQLHNNFNLKLIFDKKNKAFIDYSISVRQGDNMAGLLFLFLMQAMDDSFQAQHFRLQPEFRTHQNSNRGRLLTQPMPAQTKGVLFHFSKSMFADDTAYILLS
jgi:hypothetical protein